MSHTGVNERALKTLQVWLHSVAWNETRVVPLRSEQREEQSWQQVFAQQENATQASAL